MANANPANLTPRTSVLHEVLAAEASVKNQLEAMLAETRSKFDKAESFFTGNSKTLKMVADATTDPAVAAEEAAAKHFRPATTNVPDTLEYLFGIWNRHEDLQYQKNHANTRAGGDIILNGVTLASQVPVDELMGLEARVIKLRDLFKTIPSLDASERWSPDEAAGRGFFRTEPVTTTKTAKLQDYRTVAEATQHHPAQVVPVVKDVVVGAFTSAKFSGALPTVKKAELLTLADDLIVALRQARERANQQTVAPVQIGASITDLFRAVLAA